MSFYRIIKNSINNNDFFRNRGNKLEEEDLYINNKDNIEYDINNKNFLSNNIVAENNIGKFREKINNIRVQLEIARTSSNIHFIRTLAEIAQKIGNVFASGFAGGNFVMVNGGVMACNIF